MPIANLGHGQCGYVRIKEKGKPGICFCYCKGCDPDAPDSSHCKKHFNMCHRGCK